MKYNPQKSGGTGAKPTAAGTKAPPTGGNGGKPDPKHLPR
jgi:hypothetical protein